MHEIWTALTTFTIFENELWRLVMLFAAILIGLVAGKIGRVLMERAVVRLREQGRRFASVLLEAIAKPIVLIAFIVGLRVGLSFLALNASVEAWSSSMVEVLIVLSIGFVAYRMVDVATYWLSRAAERTKNKMDDMLAPLVRTSLRFTIAVLVILQIATMLSGRELTSILAALGVGGLAVALAAQDTVKNFFGSLVIFADKPFELGDRVLVDGHDGPIEQVGFRSTRIRTLDGHLVTIPNGELANKTIQNIGKRPYIRRIINITITYDTPPEKVKRAVEIVKDILKDHEGMKPNFPPRVFFNAFNDASLNIFAIYWYNPPDWWAFCAFGEWVNHELLRRYNEEGIDFAFPTQTLHLAGDPNRPLTVGIENKP
jgi:MscS family membrane protein